MLRLATVAGLVIDAYVHADLISRYAPNQGAAGVSQGDLFALEAGAAALAALVLVLTGRRAAWALGLLVAAAGIGALLFFTYLDPGAIGPLPDMHEPVWYPEKTLAAAAEAIGTVTALIGFLTKPRREESR